MQQTTGHGDVIELILEQVLLQQHVQDQEHIVILQHQVEHEYRLQIYEHQQVVIKHGNNEVEHVVIHVKQITLELIVGHIQHQHE